VEKGVKIRAGEEGLFVGSLRRWLLPGDEGQFPGPRAAAGRGAALVDGLAGLTLVRIRRVAVLEDAESTGLPG